MPRSIRTAPGATQVLEKAPRLDGGVDLLIIASIAGERRWIAMRETGEEAVALPGGRDAEPTSPIRRRGSRRATAAALAAVAPSILAQSYEDGRSRFWKLRYDDECAREDEARRSRSWRLHAIVDAGARGLLCRLSCEPSAALPRDRCHHVVRIDDRRAAALGLGREIPLDLGAGLIQELRSSGRARPEALGRALALSTQDCGFEHEEDARILVDWLVARGTGHAAATPAGREGGAAPFDVVNEHTTLRGRALLIRAGSRWACVVIARPHVDDAPPTAKLGARTTYVENETTAIERLLRGADEREANEAAARRAMDAAVRADEHARLLVEGLRRTWTITDIAGLADGRIAVRASCVWPTPVLAPASLPRPGWSILVQEDGSLYDLTPSGLSRHLIDDLPAGLLVEALADGLDESRRSRLVEDGLTATVAGFMAADEVEAAWSRLLAAGVRTSVHPERTPAEDASIPSGRDETLPETSPDASGRCDAEMPRGGPGMVERRAARPVPSHPDGMQESGTEETSDGDRRRADPLEIHGGDQGQTDVRRGRRAKAEAAAPQEPAGVVGRPRVHADAAARQRAYEARRRERGMVEIRFVVPSDRADEIRALVRRALAPPQTG